MSAKPFRRIGLLLCVLFAATALAQEGHPAKGSWVGEWNAGGAQPVRIVLLLDWDGKAITGTVNPGPNAIPIKLARLDIVPGNAAATPPVVPIFKLHIEADARDSKGNPVTIVADGTMDEVALPNRVLAGTWNQTANGNAQKGPFTIRRQY